MGAGIGFVRDAQNNARQNRDNLKNKSNFERTFKNKFSTKELKFKQATPEELEQFRTEFLKKKSKENIRTAILTTLIFAAVALIIWLIAV